MKAGSRCDQQMLCSLCSELAVVVRSSTCSSLLPLLMRSAPVAAPSGGQFSLCGCFLEVTSFDNQSSQQQSQLEQQG